jgi:hypothetical protein
MIKAARAGDFTLDDALCRAVEETSWAAIAAPAPTARRTPGQGAPP